MYQVVIEMKKDIPEDVLKELQPLIEGAFDNRVGTIKNSSNEAPYNYLFEGDKNKYDCMTIGVLSLKRVKMFWEHIERWIWNDEEPDECCDLCKELTNPWGD